ncbi:MAG: alpha/beta hydrolase [Bdellovibrionota bacterium]|nr:MAG: alpha/beta hydrolase [Bdellovibrionota bacterium]
MTKAIFDEVHKTASVMGSCDPLWLRNEEEPQFRTAEGGNAGPELVLLHGLFGALSNWDAVFPLFSQYSKPIALSLPILDGHRSWVKVKALAAFTQYFVLKRNLAPVALCGNSLGGHVAMRLCLAAPHIVDCLILSGTSGLYEHSVDTLPVRPDKRFIRDHMARVFYDSRFITDQAVDEIHKIVVDRMNVLNIIHAARSAKKDNLLNVLKQIKAPTLLLWGEDDQVTTMEVARTFEKNIPNAKLVSIKGCGHAPMIEKPQWFAEQVESFLKAHSRIYKKS